MTYLLILTAVLAFAAGWTIRGLWVWRAGGELDHTRLSRGRR